MRKETLIIASPYNYIAKQIFMNDNFFYVKTSLSLLCHPHNSLFHNPL